MKTLLLILIGLLLSACNSKDGGVIVHTGGIYAPVLFSLDGQDADGRTFNFGEHVLTDSPRPIEIRVHNNTQFPYTDLDLTLTADGDNFPSIGFNPDPTGEIAFPGYEGNCSRTLLPGQGCTIKVIFAPRDERKYHEMITLSFKNFIGPETHQAQIDVLAGMPASLVFTNDKSVYSFGDLAGTPPQPVVERAVPETYTQELEIVNAGGLFAHNVEVELTQSCVSTISKTCPAGMGEVYSFTTDCPKSLAPKETCNATVTYKPKNQDPEEGETPEEIREIKYGATLRFGYVKDPNGGTGGLSAHFDSNSTEIAARFLVSQKTFIIDNDVVSGNRDFRSFKINNLGFREGSIKAIEFRDSGGSFMANCVASGSSSILSCRDADGVPLTLAAFPFILKDKDSCLTLPEEEPKFVNVGSGCAIDITFQPSVTYLTDKQTEFQDLQPHVIFDSRHQGLETIVKRKLFDFSAKSISAAQVKLSRVEYLKTTYSATGDSPWDIDFGRLPLQALNYVKRKTMMIYFQNVGSVEATDVRFSDNLGMTFVPGQTVSLGTHNPKYYASVTASQTTCKIIMPGKECSMSIEFAAIGLETNLMEDQNMFDSFDTDGIPFKSLKVTYKSGAQYTDENIENAPDYPDVTVEARVRAVLVKKGLMMELADNPYNVSRIGSGFNTAGDTIISHIFLRNIGTGPIPYFRLLNPPGVNYGHLNATIIPTDNPASLGADHDCLAIGDIDLDNVVPLNAPPETRSGFSELPKEESCVFTIQFKVNDTYKKADPKRCSSTLLTTVETQAELERPFSRDSDNIEYCYGQNGDINLVNLKIVYYDGDKFADVRDSDQYGNKFDLTEYTYSVMQAGPAKLVPTVIEPWFSATLYRPSYTVTHPTPPATSVTIAPAWFFGTSPYYMKEGEGATLMPFSRADKSRHFVPTMNNFNAELAQADYVLYLGSIPEGEKFDFKLTLQNFGHRQAKITEIHVDEVEGNDLIVKTDLNTFENVGNGSTSSIDFEFDPQQTGEHAALLSLTYENGQHTDPLIYISSLTATNNNTAGKVEKSLKVLILANVMPTLTHPKITLEVEDFEMVQVPGQAPEGEYADPKPYELSWNTNAPATSIIFDTIKLPTRKFDDVYAKKRLTFTNSSPVSLSELNFEYRPNANESTKAYVTNNFKIIGNTCGSTLAAWATCEKVITYEPTASDSDSKFLMTATYKVQNGVYLMQNIGISLQPRAPGNLVVDNKGDPKTIDIEMGGGSISRSSWGLDIGKTTTLTSASRVYKFHGVANSGRSARVHLVNKTKTKASLLLAYQKYKGISDPMAVPSSGEYVNVSGELYTTIHRILAPDNTERILVQANKACLFGDDELDDSVPAHEKGFSSETTSPCYLLVTFTANLDYINKDLSLGIPTDMKYVASQIWYYSVARTATNELWLHITGKILPDASTAIGSYENVEAFENRVVTFNVPHFNPKNEGVGEVVGVRVLMSQSKNGLSDPYKNTLTDYVDIRPYDDYEPLLARFISGLTPGQFYYFRAVAIRYHKDFVDTSVPKRFHDLYTGEYLSADTSSSTPLRVLVPPVGHYYFHENQVIVDKQLTGNANSLTYKNAEDTCKGKTKVNLKNPSSTPYSYQLITKNVWQSLLSAPGATSYNNMTNIVHWMADPKASIDVEFSGFPYFNSASNSQTLTTSMVFYYRDTADRTAPVNQAMGGVPGAAYSNFWSLIHGNIAVGSARCMVVLPP